MVAVFICPGVDIRNRSPCLEEQEPKVSVKVTVKYEVMSVIGSLREELVPLPEVGAGSQSHWLRLAHHGMFAIGNRQVGSWDRICSAQSPSFIS